MYDNMFGFQGFGMQPQPEASFYYGGTGNPFATTTQNPFGTPNDSRRNFNMPMMNGQQPVQQMPTFNTAAQPAQAVLPAAPVNPWAQPAQQQNVMPQPIAPMYGTTPETMGVGFGMGFGGCTPFAQQPVYNPFALDVDTSNANNWWKSFQQQSQPSPYFEAPVVNWAQPQGYQPQTYQPQPQYPVPAYQTIRQNWKEIAEKNLAATI